LPEKPKPRELSRPAFGPFAVRVDGAIPPGSKIAVASNERFYGVLFGSVHTTLEKGEHTTEDELEGGWFITKDGVDLTFDDDLGVLEDHKGQRGKVTISGTVRARIDEPSDFVANHGSEDLDITALSQRVRGKVRELLDGEIRNMIAKDRYLTSLQSSKAIDAIKKEVLSSWTADAERDVFVAIELPKVVVRTQTMSEAPPPPEKDAEPPPSKEWEPAAPKFADGARVDVVWSDGQRYPATVRTSGCLVKFDDGQEHWIPLESLAPPKE
jgi:hypothetical protein